MIRLEVEWLDSGIIHTDGWEKKEKILELSKLTHVTTVGWKLHETEDALYIALSYDQAHQAWFGVQGIAKSAIRRITLLRARKDLPDFPSGGEIKLDETSVVDFPNAGNVPQARVISILPSGEDDA